MDNMNRQDQPLLTVKDLEVRFPVRRGVLLPKKVADVHAVDGISFSVHRGETIGLVGESGCGKSTTGLAILQLLRPSSGAVCFDGVELTNLWRKRGGRWKWSPELRELRRRMQIIFQDPHASLNPRMTIEAIISEPLANFGVCFGADRRRRVQDLMVQVGMDPRYIRRYPHEFSGGQCQRIGIARALALTPDLIVADEPISALDVSIQGQILNLMSELQAERGLTFVFIAHDLAAVRHISHRIAVMYLGKIVELAEADSLYESPLHPYTKALISSIPVPDPKIERTRERIILKGDVPSPLHPPAGCPFHTRCPLKEAKCETETPPLLQISDNHQVACHLVT